MKIFYIDPQSYNNLSVYDKSLLGNINMCDITYYHNTKYQCEVLENVIYRSVFNYSDKKHVFKAISYTFSIIKILIACIKERPDVVHIQWFRLWHVDSLFIRLLSLLNIKIVHTAHNVLPHNPDAKDRNRYMWFYKNVDAVIVHTQRSKDEMTTELCILKEKIHVIPHGILPSTTVESDVKSKAEELEKALNTKGKIVLSSLGFQNYYKGIDLISEVWRNTPSLRDNPQCMLLIVGKVENARLHELYDIPNVHIVNELVSDIDFDAYLRISSVTLLPYRKISQSGVLLTALHRNVPVLVSDVGGLPDPLRYAQVGWNIGQPSVTSLKEALILLVEHPDKITSVKNDVDSFAKVKTAYSWDKIGALTSELYKQI